MKRRQIRLYNILLPIWLLWIVPITWLVVLPVNFGIDLGVTVLMLKLLKQEDIWNKAKKSMWKTWIFGFAADFGGVAFLILGILLEGFVDTDFAIWWGRHIASSISLNPFGNIFSFLYTLIAVGISAVLIYIFNLKICLKKSGLDDNIKRKLALRLAIITAPYLFFIPTIWFI